MRGGQQHFRCRSRRPFFLPSGPDDGPAHRLFADSQFLGHLLLLSVPAGIMPVPGAQGVHHAPLRLGPLTDQPSHEPQDGFGVGARPGSGLPPSGFSCTAPDAA